MNARTRQRIALSTLAACAVALGGGCTSLRGSRFDPFPVTNGIGGGMVVSAGRKPRPAEPQPTAPAPIVQIQHSVTPMQPPEPLGQPRPLPPVPGAAAAPPPNPSTNGQPTGAPPLPGVPAPPANGRFGQPGLDPHVLDKPTAGGARLGLLPNEVPADRVVELTIHLQNLSAQNQALAARIKDLEAAAAGREQSLEEAARVIATGNAEAEKVRAALQARVAALQSKIEQMEAEDIAVLKAVIAALERLLPPAPPEKKP
ncbi:MAG: hypothetical protein ACKODX_21880 [Gemmata sp.]